MSRLLLVIALGFALLGYGSADKSSANSNSPKLPEPARLFGNLFGSTTTTTKPTTSTVLPFYNETKNGRKARFNDIDKATGDMSMPGEPARPVIEVASFCQDPGLPFKSRLSPIQSYYVDGERVTYTCENFISLKQYRTCKKGEWVGEVPICGDALRNNDLIYARIYDRTNYQMISDYNVTGKLEPFTKFGNSFIAERWKQPLRATNATNYLIELYMDQPAMFQMIRISFSVVNHLVDPRLRDNVFDIKSVTVSPFRPCNRVANNSISPWHYNSTRFDFWYFCRSESVEDFTKELKRMSSMVRIETSSQVPITLDLATFMLAEPYRNNNNLSDPICGLPEIPIGLEAKVVNDQSNYVFNCVPHFTRTDNFGGQFQLRTCGLDYRWHGDLPKCFPTRTCAKFDTSAEESLIEVYKYDRIYYHNETDWVAIKGSKAFFRCKDYTNIFVGKEIRICGEEGDWSDTQPNCLPTIRSAEPLKTTSVLILILAILIFAFILSSCTIYSFFKLRSRQVAANANGMEMTGGVMMPGDTYYSPAKDIDEVYEQVEPMAEARYAAYQPNHFEQQQHQQQHQLMMDSVGGGDYQPLYPPPPIDNTYNHMAPVRSPPGDYYDDTAIIDPRARPPPDFANSYEIMRRY